MQTAARLRGERDHARVGQGFRGDDLAGLGQCAQRQRDPVLGPVRHEHPIGIDQHAVRPEPTGDDLAVVAAPLMRQVAEQVGHLAVRGHLGEHRGHRHILARGRRHIQGEVDWRM
jgi:hypothetical protein